MYHTKYEKMEDIKMSKSNVMNGFEMNEMNDQNENAKLNAKLKSKPTPIENATPTPIENVVTPTPNVIDITPIIALLPIDKPITPSTLDKLFNLNDGGKTIRRHLRKHYATPMGHEHNTNWAWATTDPMLHEIIKYFASKYSIAK